MVGTKLIKSKEFKVKYLNARVEHSLPPNTQFSSSWTVVNTGHTVLPNNTRFVCIKAKGWGNGLETAIGGISLSSSLGQGERVGEYLLKGGV